MEVARLVALVAGIAIVVLTVWSVFTALVVPRVTSSRHHAGLARVLGGVGPLARAPAPDLRGPRPRAVLRRARPPWSCSSCSGCA